RNFGARYRISYQVYGLDYLLTWNCKHIPNAQIQKKLAQISFDAGYELPTICTPYELMGE
ncbi:MAG: type II toxin-antitoxin system VapC family toxin, partial [Moorea sp. SIO4G2]|nr:type II toxin-antitoxin system VapC family toxin [Moorena sp. SIO4G2]